MIPKLEADKGSIVTLLRGGRLPEWESLSLEEKQAYEQKHVDLMLSVAREHDLMRLEGFRLVAPQHDWKYFWIAEFPALAGAEAWIDAEMAPPYGRYGSQEYYLARRWSRDYFSSWVTHPPAPVVTQTGADSHYAPRLEVDRNSLVALWFARSLPEKADLEPEKLDDIEHEHIELMQSVARKYGLIRLEGFRLIAPLSDWHRAWVVELPTLDGLQAWIEAEIQPPLGRYSTKAYYLAHKWAPDYFHSWVSR